MRSEKRSDVIVIGGGPSGLRAAARLAAGGLDVRLFERKAAVGRDVLCTGIVGRDVFARFGLGTGPVLNEVGEARLVSPFGAVVAYAHPRPFACVVDRERFDAALAESAAAEGAALETGTRVETIEVEPGRVRLTVRRGDSGPVRHSAAVAVIATGVDGALQRQAGLGQPRDFLGGAQVELPARPGGTTSIFFGRGVAPGAFAWSVPAGERMRLGLLTKGEPRALLRKFLSAREAEAGPAAGDALVRTRPVAQGLVARTTADRVLSVGEAAGQVKTTTGGGISYGLLCADLAAETILACFRRASFGAADMAAYERRWRQAVEKEILVGYYARRMCSRLSDGRVEDLFRLARTDGIIPIIRETADFDWHSGLILALLERLSFMRYFRTVKDGIGRMGLS
ncbi:MAG TPA: NAD(P)/FAD-dependent oxidoreductase [Terriglobales bacterium]|nr:NAD(P)/FAD-dependent oxidoreductase [Terriglobales bacterium]